jgi:hypothetical protein
VSTSIIPVSRSLFLCDFHIGYQDARVDLYGILNALRPAVYPYVHPHLVVFAQLTGGIGDVPFFCEIRRARDNDLVRVTGTNLARSPNQTIVYQLALTLESVEFHEPGVVVSLFCHNTWVCDTALTLR